MTNSEIGRRIKITREELGLTLDDIATKLTLNKSTIQRYETGSIKKLKLPVIQAIARCLNVNPDWIIGKSDNKNDLEQTKSPSQLSDRDKAFVELIKSLTDDERVKIADYIKYVISQRD